MITLGLLGMFVLGFFFLLGFGTIVLIFFLIRRKESPRGFEVQPAMREPEGE